MSPDVRTPKQRDFEERLYAGKLTPAEQEQWDRENPLAAELRRNPNPPWLQKARAEREQKINAEARQAAWEEKQKLKREQKEAKRIANNAKWEERWERWDWRGKILSWGIVVGLLIGLWFVSPLFFAFCLGDVVMAYELKKKRN